MKKELDPASQDKRLADIKRNITSILGTLGEDVSRPGLKDTPKRYAKAMEFFTSGYDKDVDKIVGSALFE